MKTPSRPFLTLPAPWGYAFLFAIFTWVGLRPAPVQAQRLTEMMAVNTVGLLDEEGTPQPWVEIWNQNSTSVLNLVNHKLSWTASGGSAVIWPIPTIQIMPDERIVIFASGKNRSVVTSPLHTNFILAPEAGGTLTLLGGSNNTLSSFSSIPAQVANVSFGRDDSDAATIAVRVGTYTQPTPGEKNKYAGPGVAGEVIFDVNSRSYSGPLTITLSQAVPEEGAVIRYTTNRTLPSATSTAYTVPITLTATGASTLIRARVFATGKLPGPTNTQGYLRLEPTAQTFTSSMPVVVVSTFGTSFPTDVASDFDINSYMWVWAPGPDNITRLTDAPVIACRTVVDKRGSSTFGNAKASLNLEARTPFDEDEMDISLLGMPTHSDWVLHAPFHFDRSLLHNPLMYALSNDVGQYAVRNRMAEVFLDTTAGGLTFTNAGSGDYFGVYNVMEKIRRGSSRVDVSKLETYDNDLVSKTGGYIFKVDRRDQGDVGFSIGAQGSLAYYYPKERDLVSPQRDPQQQYLSTYLNEFNTRLNGPNWKDPVLGYATHLDVPAAIDHHLLNVWSFNVDALRLSGYWTKDRNGKIYPGPIWDFDRALSSTDGRDENPLIWRANTQDLGTDFFNYVWWNRLFLDLDFYQKYIDRWQELRTGPLARAAVEARIDALNAEISATAIARDLTRWSNAKRSWTRPFPAPNNNFMPASQAAEVQRIKDWMQQRATFMDSQWVGPVSASAAAGYLAPGSTVTLTGPAGVPIYYTLNGTDPRPSGGAAPGAGPVLYTGPITITANTRLLARAYKSTHTALTGTNNPPLVSRWSGLTDATYTIDLPAAPGSLLLSEINYHPADPTPAELAINPAWTDNDFEFLEIRNISPNPVNLNGANFTRGITYTFTGEAARTLAPGESLIIASNPTAYAARYGAGPAASGPWAGSLSNSSENITLLADNGQILFDVTYADSWYPSSDGGGFTLVAWEYYPFDVNSGSAWRASSSTAGSPGTWDPASLNVSAGPDQTLAFGAPLTLSGAVLPPPGPEPTLIAWSQVSGPGTINVASPGSAVSTATATVPGTYVVRISFTVNALTTTDDATLFIHDSAAAWLARNPGIGTMHDDHDQDGRTNFLEFALNTSPTLPTGSAPPQASVLNNRMVLEFQRHIPAAGLTYQVQISETLGAWRLPNPGEITETIIEDTGILQTIRVNDTVILGTPTRRFLRLKVTAP